MIVDGAVGMVEMALERLNENHTINLDEERKAAMVSNLLVVLCGNHDAQPVVNSGVCTNMADTSKNKSRSAFPPSFTPQSLHGLKMTSDL